MDQLYLFLIRNDIWIYIICGLGLFWYISEFIRARRQLRRAVFGLERETGNRVQTNSLLFILLLGGIVAGVIYVNLQILPELPAELLRPPTPTPDIFNEPLRSPTPLTNILLDSQATPTSPIIAATVTLEGTDDVGGNQQATAPQQPDDDEETTPEPDATTTDGEAEATVAPAPPVGGCSTLVNITQPSNGSSVFGSVAFLGSASNESFAFYKLEISGPQTNNQWASLIGQVISNPVANGLLGSANFNGWVNGRYTVRLTVVDATSNEVANCSIQINVTS